MKFNRRTFLGFPLILFAGQAYSVENVNPADPTAKAIGYVEKSPVAGAICNNCIQARAGSGSHIPCNLFPNKLVNKNGWCKVYVKKP